MPPPGSVAVSHRRELRGAWISSVHNGTWPSAPGLTEADAKEELVAILDALASAHLNAVFLQVRPESDALYASRLEPWSRFLGGTQGEDPGWDPLAFAIEESHRRGLELHAWMNPYRAAAGSGVRLADTSIARTMPEATRTYGEQLWMDPGVPSVRAHILEVVGDVLDRYDVDGIHFDDYFYPYPIRGETFDDADSFAAARSPLKKDDWRRSNVDALVREVGGRVARKPGVRFGISPFGIYRPGTPEGITGLDAWATLYCDPVRWMNEGWVDYIAPQLYWPTTQKAQDFDVLAPWWGSLAKDGRSVFIGHDATKAGQGAFPLEEYDRQLERTRETAAGSIFFAAGALVKDQAGLRSRLAERWWTGPAATPPLASAARATALAPILTRSGSTLRVETPAARAVAVYRDGALERLVPATPPETTLTLPAGSWAVSTLDRRGVESFGAPIVVP